MTAIPQKKIHYFPFTKGKYQIEKSFEDNSFLFAFSLSFGFFILIVVSYLWKNKLYNKKGYLNTEKSELKYLLEDMKDKSQYSSKKHRNSRRLLSLLTEHEDSNYKDCIEQEKVHQASKSQRGANNTLNAIQLQINSPSKLENILKHPELSLSIEDNNKWSIHHHNQEPKNQLGEQEILFENNKIKNLKSRSGLLNFDQLQPSNINSVIHSPINGQDNNDQCFQKEGESDDKENQMQKKLSMMSSFNSIPRSHRFQSTADTTSITPCSANSSCIQPPSQNQKFIESFTSIVIVQEKKGSNSNRPTTFQQNDINQNEKAIQHQQKSMIDYLQKSNEPNLLPIQKIKSTSYEQEMNSKRDAKQKNYAVGTKGKSSQNNNQMNEKEKNKQYADQLELQEQKENEKNVDLSFDKNTDQKESSSFWQRFIKNWKRLFVRHCILLNTMKQDTILFPRGLKIIIISIFVNLQFLAGTLIQIYLYNQQVIKLEKKYHGRDDHVVYKQTINPSQDPSAVIFEVATNLAVSALFLILMIILAFLSKGDKDILFINTNNEQLLRNLQQIQGGQSYKQLIGLIVAFCLGAISFLQYTSFMQKVEAAFVNRWFFINMIIITLYFNIFDLLYLSILALLKAASKFSARCHTIYHYLIKKLSWWSL